MSVGVDVSVDATSSWASKNTTTVYGYKNAHHTFNIVTKVTKQLMPVFLVDSACSTHTAETLSG